MNTRATSFNSFYEAFCNAVVKELGGPDKSKLFFDGHRLVDSRMVAARASYFDGLWGYTGQAAGKSWAKNVTLACQESK